MPIALVLDVHLGLGGDEEVPLRELEERDVLVELEVLGDFVDDVVDLQRTAALLHDVEGVVVDGLLEDGDAVDAAVAEAAVERIRVAVPVDVEHAAVVDLCHAVRPARLVADLQRLEEAHRQLLAGRVEPQCGDHEVVRV